MSDNAKENKKALEKCGDDGPFKFTYKQAWASHDSTDLWIGPWWIDTPKDYGKKLKISGHIDWNDQGYGNSKG